MEVIYMVISESLKLLLENLGFQEHHDKLGLYLKRLEEKDSMGEIGVTAYIDFRKNDKGRRFYTVEGVEGYFDNEDDVNSIPVLQYFKTERDKILGISEDSKQNLPAKQKQKKDLVVGSCESVALQYGIPKELANMFFMTFDNGLYIKNPGLLYLAQKRGYSRIEIMDKFNEQTQEWEAECKIYPKVTTEILEGIGKLDKELQKQALDFITSPTNGKGRASKSNVRMNTMHPFLEEMAQTRAANRALRNFTGYGGSSAEELQEGQIEVLR